MQDQVPAWMSGQIRHLHDPLEILDVAVKIAGHEYVFGILQADDGPLASGQRAQIPGRLIEHP